jgi:phenylpropionate dioxygenase-like ring-hydroxylating dioxygenase large terminal subunit
MARTPLEKAPEPDLGTDLIPKERYTSRAFMELELERMWPRAWLMAGALADLEEVGDYFTFEIGRESIIVVRSAPDRIDAFHNACQHRGYRICEQERGHDKTFVCPYHLWAYDLRGKLRGVPDREDYPQGIPDDARLQPVLCDVWGAWVFVNMNPDAEPLAEYLGEAGEHLEPYHFERNYALTEDITFLWDCNWKVGVDAFNEVYHVQGIHPELLEISDDVDCPIDLYGKHSRFLFKVGVPSPRWTDTKARAAGYRDRNQVTKEMAGVLEAFGLDPKAFDGRVDEIRPALIQALRATAEQADLDFDDLDDEQLWMDVHYSFFPNITFNISPGHFWLFRSRPHPTDPDKMYWDYQNWARIPRGADRPPRPVHRHAVWGDGQEKELHLALRQDGDAAAPIQAGMHSRGFEGLHLAAQERRIRLFHKVLGDYIESED